MRYSWRLPKRLASTDIPHEPPPLPNMTVEEFLSRVNSVSFSYKMAVAQLKKTDDQSSGQIEGAIKRRDEAAARLQQIAKEFAHG
jgi:hypothetical protein